LVGLSALEVRQLRVVPAGAKGTANAAQRDDVELFREIGKDLASPADDPSLRGRAALQSIGRRHCRSPHGPA